MVKTVIHPASYQTDITLSTGVVHAEVEWYERRGHQRTVIAVLNGMLRVGNRLFTVQYWRDGDAHGLKARHVFEQFAHGEDCTFCSYPRDPSLNKITGRGHSFTDLRSQVATNLANRLNLTMNVLEAEIMGSAIVDLIFAVGEAKHWPELEKTANLPYEGQAMKYKECALARRMLDPAHLFGANTDWAEFRSHGAYANRPNVRVRVRNGVVEANHMTMQDVIRGPLSRDAAMALVSSMKPHEELIGFSSDLRIFGWDPIDDELDDIAWFSAMCSIADHENVACPGRPQFGV